MTDIEKLKKYIRILLIQEMSTTSNVPGYSSKYFIKPTNTYKKQKDMKVSGSQVLNYKID